MTRPYEPPRHLSHLAKTVNAARTQLGWGVHDDGSVGIEHIISANPFAGKTQVWGTAEIDDQGDVQIVSQGPGNSPLANALPEDLVTKIVHFYEKEGLNVRNISEANPALKEAEVENGRKVCPQCGEDEELHLVPSLGAAVCANCRWSGPQEDLIDYGTDPDPDRRLRPEDENHDHTINDYDDWDDHFSMKEAAGSYTIQGAAGEGSVATGIALRPDRQSEEEINQMLQFLRSNSPSSDENYRNYVQKLDPSWKGSPYEHPLLNRGGSWGFAEKPEDHFLDSLDIKEAAPVGIPSAGMTDLRNFSPENQPNHGFILVSSYFTTDHTHLILDPMCNGIIAEAGGPGSHGAVVARGAGIPFIVPCPEATKIEPGEEIRMDPATGKIDVGGGDESFELGEVKRAAHELVRYVWSKGTGVYSPVSVELTDELAAQPYEHEGQPDRSHTSMIEYLMMEDKYDFDDATIGVIYSDGRALYYEPITDEPALENWLKSTFPTQVKEVVYQATKGGIYAPAEPAVHAKQAENNPDASEEKAPQCPECGSHSYALITMPPKAHGKAELRCLNCKTHYEHLVYRNPKQTDFQKGAPYPENSYKNAPDHTPKGQKEWPEEVNAIYNACVREKHGESGEASDETKSSCAAIAWAQYKKNDGKPKDSDKKKSKLVLAGSTHECEYCGHPEDDHDPTTGECKSCNCQTFTPQKNSKLAEGKYGPGTRVEVDHPNLRGRGTILDCSGKHKDLDEDQYTIQMDDGDQVEDIPESAFKKIKSANVEDVTLTDLFEREAVTVEELLGPGKNGDGTVPGLLEGTWDEQPVHSLEVKVLDTNGAPLTAGELYLMHSKKYKVPDLVRIINVTPQQIEAHIDSDTRGAFPIEIKSSEYTNLGYTFEPYQKTSSSLPDWFEAAASLAGVTALVGSVGIGSVWQHYRELFGQNPRPLPTVVEGIKEVASAIGLGEDLYEPDWESMHPQSKLSIVDEAMTNLFGELQAALHGHEVSDAARQIVEALKAQFGDDPQKIERVIPDADALSNFLNYYHEQHLEPVADDSGMERNSKESARRISVTPKRQRELIEENLGARARNFDKLVLDNTHYTFETVPASGSDIEDHYLW